MAKPAMRAAFSWFIRLAITVALLWLVARKLSAAELRRLWGHLHYGWLLCAFGVMLLSRVFSCSRLILLVKAKDPDVSAREVARVVLVSEFVGAFLPASIGGDFIRFYGLKRQNAASAEAASAVWMERILGVMALLFLGSVGACWAWSHLADHPLVAASLVPSLAGLAFCAAALNENWVRSAARRLGVQGHWFVDKIQRWQRAVHAYRKQPRVLAEAFVISVCIQACRIVSTYLVALALGAKIAFGFFVLLVPLILLISLMPISIGGLGVRENAFVHCFGQVGVAAVMAFSISILTHALSLIAHGPGGVWSFLAPSRRRRPVAAEIPASTAPPIRVLRVIDKLGYEGHMHGPGRTWFNTLVFIDPARFRVVACVLRLHPKVRNQFAAQGVEVRDLRKGRFDPTALTALIGLIRLERIDIIHAEGNGSSLFGRLAGWLTGVPVIVQYHDLSKRVPWYMRLADRALAARTTRAVAVGEAVAEACVRQRHLARARISIVHNVVDPAWAASVNGRSASRLRDAWAVPPAAPVIGSLTRFHRVKDIPTLLKAAADLSAHHADAHVVLVGDGPDRSAILEQIKALNLIGRVHLVGYQEDPRPYLALMDVAVFCSLDEGFPNAVLEAMTHGLAIVATDAGGTRELIRDGVNGLLVPPGNPQALSAAIALLLEDRTLAARLARQAKQDSALYNVPAHVERLQQLYDEVMRLPRARQATQQRYGSLSAAAEPVR